MGCISIEGNPGWGLGRISAADGVALEEICDSSGCGLDYRSWLMLYLSIVKLGAPELQVSEVQKGRRMPPSSYYYQANIGGYGLFAD